MQEHITSYSETAHKVRRFRKTVLLTICAVFFLILVGGIVRMTGSGMGCPDWPKCFGMWIPPTVESQLPENYQEIYADHGYGDTRFNAVKTWIEYVNRLIGVLIGFFAIGTFYVAWPLRRTKLSSVFWLSALGLFLIVVQGGIGARVVHTNLAAHMISIHMFVALITLLVYISAYLIAFEKKPVLSFIGLRSRKSLVLWGGVVMLLTLIQVILGTEVRGGIDAISAELDGGSRETWIEKLGTVYSIHKYFYYAIVVTILYWSWLFWTYAGRNIRVRVAVRYMIGILFAEILFGISMHHFAIPAFLQPLHLLFAISLFAIEFLLLFSVLCWFRFKERMG